MDIRTLQKGMTVLPDMQYRKINKDPNKMQSDKFQKLKQKSMKQLQMKEQLNLVQKQRSKLQQKPNRHHVEQDASTSFDSFASGKEECFKQNKDKLRLRREHKKLVHKSKFDTNVQQDVNRFLQTCEESIFSGNSSQLISPQQENATILLGKEFQQSMQLNAAQEQQIQQGILPQEVVLVSYNGDEIPSETGIIAYDENGQLLLIRESDVKAVDSCSNQHLLHTFDGTTYIIDNAIQTVDESTYIVLDRSLVPTATLLDPNAIVTIAAAGQTTEYSLEINDCDEFEMYQAMTAVRIAETNETSSVLTQPPIMSVVETPSILQSSNALKLNRRPADLCWPSQSIDDSLAKIGVVTSQQSAIPLALQLPPTVTDPVITSSIANTIESDDCKQIIFTSNKGWQ